MPLWTEVIQPDILTGYARASLADLELRRGTLARWLPNRTVADTVVRFIAGAQGNLVDVASFRAYDAEPEIGKGVSGKRYTIELPALGQKVPVSEYAQLRMRNLQGDEAAMANSIRQTTDRVVRAVADSIERLRGVVLETGKATISQTNFATDDDFARSASMTVTAGSLWSTASVDRLAQLTTWQDLYTDTNGEAPGCMMMSTRAFRALASGSQFQTQLLNGGARNATPGEVNATIEAQGLPPIYLYDRRVSVNGTMTRVTSDNKIFMLPAPVDPNAADGTDLGGTWWGQTLTSTSPDFQLAAADQPGMVAGVWRNETPPMIAEVIGDAISLPVLTNPNLSLVGTVL